MVIIDEDDCCFKHKCLGRLAQICGKRRSDSEEIKKHAQKKYLEPTAISEFRGSPGIMYGHYISAQDLPPPLYYPNISLV